MAENNTSSGAEASVITEALSIIDGALGRAVGRELVSIEEFTDVLLDARLALASLATGTEVEESQLEPAI